VAEEHPWAGITHNIPDLFSLVWLIAMNWAASTGWLSPAKWAAVDAFRRVIKQGLAIRTQFTFGRMMHTFAVDQDHLMDGFPLTFQAFAFLFCLGCHESLHLRKIKLSASISR